MSEVEREREWWDGLEGQDVIDNTSGVPPYDAADVAMSLIYKMMLKPGQKVLDLGCGLGRLTNQFAAFMPDQHFTGVDISPKMTGMANLLTRRNTEFVVCDGRTLPFDDNVFDKAYSVTVFQHLPADAVRGYLREVHRVLRPWGSFIWTWSDGTEDTFLSHQTDEETMMEWAEDAGFELVVGDSGRDERGWRWCSATRDYWGNMEAIHRGIAQEVTRAISQRTPAAMDVGQQAPSRPEVGAQVRFGAAAIEAETETTVTVPTLINERWTLNLPEHRAVRPEWPTWEKERLASMHENLKPGAVVYDIGAEEGDLPGLWASWGCQVALFEPNPKVWPNIRAVWEANRLPKPLGCFVGFAGQRTYEPDPRNRLEGSGWIHGGWPACAYGPLIGDHGFLNLSERPDVPVITIDEASKHIKAPDAITIDVEGAELHVLRGARDILSDFRPLVWVSVHAEFIKEMYGQTRQDVFEFMKRMRYHGATLAVDHEEHVFFYPREMESMVVLP